MDTDQVEQRLSSDFINDPNNVFSLFQEVTVNARFVIDKIWENAKFFTTVTSAVGGGPQKSDNVLSYKSA